MLLIEETYRSCIIQSLGSFLLDAMKSRLYHSQDHYLWDHQEDLDAEMGRLLSSQHDTVWSGLTMLFERDGGQTLRKVITIIAPSKSTTSRELASIYQSLVHALCHAAPEGFPRISLSAFVCGIETALKHLQLPMGLKMLTYQLEPHMRFRGWPFS